MNLVISGAPTYDVGSSVPATLDTSGRLRTGAGIDQTTPGTTDSVTVSTAQGAGAAIGAKADTLYTGGVGSWSIVALLKGLYAQLIAATPAGANTIGGTTDAGPAWTTVWGISGLPFTSADQHSAVASVSDAPTSGQKLVIDDIIVSVDTAMSVTFKCETTGAVVCGPFYLPANSQMQVTPRGKGRKLATADKKLQVMTSVAGNIMVDVGYHSEA